MHRCQDKAVSFGQRVDAMYQQQGLIQQAAMEKLANMNPGGRQ